jgi:hypothetical protein
MMVLGQKSTDADRTQVRGAPRSLGAGVPNALSISKKLYVAPNWPESFKSTIRVLRETAGSDYDPPPHSGGVDTAVP